jgi:hypothetical protein
LFVHDLIADVFDGALIVLTFIVGVLALGFYLGRREKEK